MMKSEKTGSSRRHSRDHTESGSISRSGICEGKASTARMYTMNQPSPSTSPACVARIVTNSLFFWRYLDSTMGHSRAEMVRRQRWHGIISVCLVIRVLSLMVIRTLHRSRVELLSEQLVPQGVDLQLRVWYS
ncbi:hypothetical protein GJ744_007641 [Endocarpon pusillum]|uniref:Uncharacterized protein n=1 Tax=Endocarpon pusillum TaxID=364733 RepID=A0A8H7AID3_9EURO|nr:hypothetical protein GJ744_007641 [Endocarpon pusillum]